MAGSGIDIPLVIENEAQAKQALKDVTNNIKQLNSELKTIGNSYDKNNKAVEDYKKEQEQLSKIIESQKEKINVLNQAYEKSKQTAGENAEKTTAWKLKLESAQRSLQNYEKSLAASTEQMKALEKQMSAADITKPLAEAENKLKLLESELKTLSNSYDKNNKSTQDYKKEQEQLSKIIESQKNKISILNQAYEESRKETGKNSSETVNWKLKLDEAQRGLQNYEKSLAASTEQMKALEKQTKETAEATSRLINEQFLAAGDKLSNIGNKLSTGVTLPVTIAGGFSIKSSANFEKSMSKVKAISEATGDEFDKLSEKAKQMGASTSKSATESANALENMSLAGWNTQQKLTGLELILRESEVGEMDLATASKLTTDSMASMGIQVNDLGHYLDIVTQAQNSSNTSMQELLTAYVSCGGSLKNLNVSLEESSTLLGILANRGIKGSEAGTALNSIFVNLVGASSSANTAMTELGVSAWDAEGNFIGITKTLNLLNEALNSCTDEEKAMFEASIGGKTQLDTLQALLSGVSEEYDELNAKISDCNGTLLATAAIMQDNLAGDFTTLKSQLEAVGISIGDIITPQIRELVKTLTNILKGFNELDDGTKRLIISTVAFAAAIGPVTKGVGAISSSVGSAVGVVGKFVSALSTGKTAMQAFTIACDANPVMLVASAIAMVVAAFAAYNLTKEIEETNAFAESIKKETEALKANREALIENGKSVDDNVKKVNAQVEAEKRNLDTLEEKIPKMEELAKKTEKTAEEEDELKRIIEEMNKAMPDLKLAIDEETGALNKNTGAVKESIEAYKKLAEAKGIAKSIESTAELKTSSEVERKVAYQNIKSTISNAGYNTLYREKYADWLNAMERIEKGEKVMLPKIDELPQAKNFKNLRSETVNAEVEKINELIKTYVDAQSEYSNAGSKLDMLYRKQGELQRETYKANLPSQDIANAIKKAATDKRATETSQLTEEQNNELKMLELKHKNELISESEYIKQREALRDKYFVKDSEGWLEHNAQILSLKKSQNKAVEKSDSALAKQAEANTKALLAADEKLAKEIKEQNEKIFDEDIQKSLNWIDKQEFKDSWEDIGDTAEAAYDRILKRIDEKYKDVQIGQEKIDKKVEEVMKLKDSAIEKRFEERLQEYKDFISDRFFYDDWDKFNQTETDIINEELRILEKYYNAGYLAKKDYLKRCKELNKEIYTANKEAEKELVDEVTKKWDKILSDKRQQIEGITEKLNSRISELESGWATEDRQKSLEELREKANLYKGAVTSAGQEKYESILGEIKQLEREEQRAKLEEENNRIIAQMEAEYKELEQRKAEELEIFNNLSLAEQKTTNELLGEIAEKLGSANVDEILSSINLEQIGSGEEFRIFNDNDELKSLDSINIGAKRDSEYNKMMKMMEDFEKRKETEIQKMEEMQSKFAEKFNLNGLAAAISQLTAVTKNITNNYIQNDNSKRVLTNTQYIRDNVDMDIAKRSLSDILN